MARTSSGKTGSKRKHAGVGGGKGRSATASKAQSKSRALRAKSDPVRTQELPSGAIESDHDQVPALSPGLEMMGLMSRTVSASLALPIGMTRCTTPFEVWGAQSRFLQDITQDCQAVTLRMMSAAFRGSLAPAVASTRTRKRARSNGSGMLNF
jgi:hypothetical protein